MNINQIIKGCQQYDERSQFELVKRFTGKLKSVCYFYVKNEETAKDVLQESFMIIFTKINTYSGEGAFEGWMRSIAVRCSLQHLRKVKLINKVEDHNRTSQIFSPRIYDELSKQEIMKLIQSLPEINRLVFSLNIIEGYSHTEISELLDINVSTSRSYLLRARKALQKKLILNDIKLDQAI